MIEEFPFLLPRNRWTGEVHKDYDYSYTELGDLDYGWAKAFGYELICELRDSLKKANYLDKYRITQIKEKYGTLRWYDCGAPKEVFDVIRKYIKFSSKVCIRCGKPATHITSGWINYMCKECIEECNLNALTIEEYAILYEEDEEI